MTIYTTTEKYYIFDIIFVSYFLYILIELNR